MGSYFGPNGHGQCPGRARPCRSPLPDADSTIMQCMTPIHSPFLLPLRVVVSTTLFIVIEV